MTGRGKEIKPSQQAGICERYQYLTAVKRLSPQRTTVRSVRHVEEPACGAAWRPPALSDSSLLYSGFTSYSYLEEDPASFTRIFAV